MIILLTSLISLLGGIIGAVITLLIKTILDKESHKTNKFYEYRADVILELYSKTNRLSMAVTATIDPLIRGNETRQGRIENAIALITEFENYYMEKNILLPHSIKNSIETKLQLLVDITKKQMVCYELSFPNTRLFNEEERQKILDEAVKNRNEAIEIAMKEIPPLRDQLNKAYEVLLGK